ncbi:MAG: metal ABC transporter ATP-binding protein [Ignavibacteria bacterium]|nr:metal ABC transporter ATP-binding protein [Ignavibacteria bacterium]
MNVISIKNLTISYHRKPAIRGISLEIEKGSIIAIIGPNGAGKSTLLKGILGLLPFDSGEVKIFGEDVDKVRKKISYIPQREQFDWDFPINVYELVMMGRYAHIPFIGFPRRKDKQVVINCLEKLEIERCATRQIRNLSGGQQQRAFIARALAQESDIYFMDEPFVGVDAKTEKSIFSLMNELKSEGKTIMVVHHDLSKIKGYYDKVIMINQTLIAYGNTNDVFTPELINKTYGGRLTILQKTEELI